MTDFLAMGGHGGYVWSAYAITLIVLVVSGWAASRRHRQALHVASQAGTRPAPARQPTVTEL